MHDSAAAPFAEEALLLPSTVACAIKIGNRVILGELKEGKYCRCTESTC